MKKVLIVLFVVMIMSLLGCFSKKDDKPKAEDTPKIVTATVFVGYDLCLDYAKVEKFNLQFYSDTLKPNKVILNVGLNLFESKTSFIYETTRNAQANITYDRPIIYFKTHENVVETFKTIDELKASYPNAKIGG